MSVNIETLKMDFLLYNFDITMSCILLIKKHCVFPGYTSISSLRNLRVLLIYFYSSYLKFVESILGKFLCFSTS